jgi:hypothetical protein
MKRSVVAIVLLAALIGVYLLVQSRKQNVVSANRPFVMVDSVAVTKLYIESALDTVQIEKQGDKWAVTKPINYPAADKTVAMALGRFREMEKLSLISSKQERQAEFQVDAANGAKVVVTQGGKSMAFWVGKSSSTGGTSFARVDGSNDIWEVSGVFAPTFKRKAKDWRDKTITELDAANFSKFTLQYPDEMLTVTLVDTTWNVDAGKVKFMAEKDLVGRLTNLLSRLSTIDFADTLGPNFFDRPACHLVADMADGSAIDLKLVPKDAEGNQYFLRKAGAAADFVIYKSTASVLMKRAADFRSPPPESSKQEGKKAVKKA